MGSLIRPLPGSPTISQVWGPTAFAGEPAAFGHAHFHLGVDYAVPCGTAVHAPATGVVAYSGWDDTGFGLVLIIDHPEGVRSYLAHLHEVLVARGAQVSARQTVARSGTTGNSTGCHLHFGVQLAGQWVPPASEMDLRTW